MVNQDEAPRRRLFGGRQYALIAALTFAAALAGLVAGRGLAASSRSQQPSGNEIAVPAGGLVFRSKEGKVVAKIDADDGGGFLTIYNAAEKPVVTMGGSSYGGGALVGLSSGKGAGSALQLSANEEGGRVSLLGKHGKQVVLLGAGERGGEIEVSDGSGKIIWSPVPQD
jgi:hypothetical protein